MSGSSYNRLRSGIWARPCWQPRCLLLSGGPREGGLPAEEQAWRLLKKNLCCPSRGGYLMEARPTRKLPQGTPAFFAAVKMEGLFRALGVIRDWHHLLHFRTVTELLHLARRLLSPGAGRAAGRRGLWASSCFSVLPKLSVVKGCGESVFNRVGFSSSLQKKGGGVRSSRGGWGSPGEMGTLMLPIKAARGDAGGVTGSPEHQLRDPQKAGGRRAWRLGLFIWLCGNTLKIGVTSDPPLSLM